MNPLVPGMTIVKSNGDAARTIARLEGVLLARGMTVFAKIDHMAGAKAVGLDLRPTTVIIFGDAKVGTKIMQSAQTAGFDLPLRVLVWTDEKNETWLGTTDMSVLASHHGIPATDATVVAIAHALSVLAAAVTSEDGAP